MTFKVGDRVRRTTANATFDWRIGAEALVESIAWVSSNGMVRVTTAGCTWYWHVEDIEHIPLSVSTTNETGAVKHEGFTIKDSGARQEFAGGMVRDTATGKPQYHRVLEGPMFNRWATHLTKGAVKYPDRETGEANWTLAGGAPEARRFKESALRHFIQWWNGATDEDHASAILFNINGAEFVKEKLSK